MNNAQSMALLSLTTCIALFFFITHIFSPTKKNQYHVGILVSAQHPALNLTLEALKKKILLKLNQEVRFIEFNGNGSPDYLQNSARTLTLNEHINLFVALGSPACHALLKLEKEKPIVFAAVSDPELHTLHYSNLCGISDKINRKQHVALIKKIMPNIKSTGILYTPDEPHIVEKITEIKELLEHEEITPVEINLRQKDSLKKYQSVDVLFALEDNTIALSMKNIANQALELKKPLFASYTPAVTEGALAAQGVNYHDCGTLAGKFSLKILKNKAKPQQLRVTHLPDENVVINKQVSEILKVKIPKELETKVRTYELPLQQK